MIDLAKGHPPASALPAEEWAEATARAMRRHGAEALNYGDHAGPMVLREWISVHVGVGVDEVFVTAGASHALDLVTSVLTKPGDTVLVDSPTYHYALRLLRGSGLVVKPIPDDLSDLDGRMIYTVPTFANPTGHSLTYDQRLTLIAAAQHAGVTIVEDDTYRELFYDDFAPPSLYGLSGGQGVVRLGTFSKTVAPGLRLGWINAAPEFVKRLCDRGYIVSGGGINHATAVTMATFAEMGHYEPHVTRMRALYGGQRDALVKAVREHLPEAEFETPGGGWFLWVKHPRFAGMHPAGVSYMDGRQFFCDPCDDAHIRLSFSQSEPYQLREGVKLMAAALR